MARDEVGRAPFVGGIAKREEIADRDRLDSFVLDQTGHGGAHPRLVERNDDGAVGTDPLGDACAAAPGGEKDRRLGVHEEVVHARALLPADLEHVLEPLGHQETDACALLLQDRVGGDGRAVHEAIDVFRRLAAQCEHRVDSGQHSGGEILRRRGHLCGPDSVAALADDVGEGASDVDSDSEAAVRFGHRDLRITSAACPVCALGTTRWTGPNLEPDPEAVLGPRSQASPSHPCCAARLYARRDSVNGTPFSVPGPESVLHLRSQGFPITRDARPDCVPGATRMVQATRRGRVE